MNKLNLKWVNVTLSFNDKRYTIPVPMLKHFVIYWQFLHVFTTNKPEPSPLILLAIISINFYFLFATSGIS